MGAYVASSAGDEDILAHDWMVLRIVGVVICCCDLLSVCREVSQQRLSFIKSAHFNGLSIAFFVKGKTATQATFAHAKQLNNMNRI